MTVRGRGEQGLDCPIWYGFTHVRPSAAKPSAFNRPVYPLPLRFLTSSLMEVTQQASSLSSSDKIPLPKCYPQSLTEMAPPEEFENAGDLLSNIPTISLELRNTDCVI